MSAALLPRVVERPLRLGDRGPATDGRQQVRVRLPDDPRTRGPGPLDQRVHRLGGAEGDREQALAGAGRGDVAAGDGPAESAGRDQHQPQAVVDDELQRLGHAVVAGFPYRGQAETRGVEVVGAAPVLRGPRDHARLGQGAHRRTVSGDHILH